MLYLFLFMLYFKLIYVIINMVMNMLVNMNEILNEAKESKCAVGQYNIINLEWTRYILEVNEEMKTPVILGVSEGAISYMGGYNVVVSIVKSLLIDLKITIPVVIHLDHGTSFQSCKKAIDAGFTSVMIDASRLSLKDNISITKAVCEYAHIRNISVEAEVGHIGGTEDNISSEIAYAKVEDCVALVYKTKVDVLAPALGSVHGLYKGEPNLNFERMKKVSELLNTPLVLHGASGIDDERIEIAIESGISKINLDTEIKMAWNKAVREFISTSSTYDPRKIIKSGEEAIKNVVRNKIILFRTTNIGR